MVKMKDACGLFGVFGDPAAVELTYCGLFTLQHRGQESAGIASIVDGKIASYKGMGNVAVVFKGRHLEDLKSNCAIGHVRYSTTGESHSENAQPIVVRYHSGQQVALGHNGNLVNRMSLRNELELQGSIFASTTDSEVVLHLLARMHKNDDLDDALIQVLRRLKGAFSLLMMWNGKMVAVRDPWGFRPLWWGKKGDAHVFASETAAFDIIHAEALEEIKPGTFMVVDENGKREVSYIDEKPTPAHCLFEHIYFARPDSRLFGDLAQDVRIAAGRQLAREHEVEADMVCSIPDSGNEAALGYSLESGIPLAFAFVRNHYIGRTFIKPSAKDRLAAADLKLNVIKSSVKGKRVVVVDDSMIRGTTAKNRIQRLREAGAKEIHFRISCPPIRNPCYYGIDFQSKGELIAAKKTLEEIREFLQLDTLGYLSLDGLLSCVTQDPGNYCTACWSGNYPVLEDLDDDFERC
jgi:amidophosphoribosyltransferase